MTQFSTILGTGNAVAAMAQLMQLADDRTQLQHELLTAAEAHGWPVVTLLSQLAEREQTAFWFAQLGFLLSFHFHYVDGAQLQALNSFIQAHEADPENTGLLESILDFSGPPEPVLEPEAARAFARKLLALQPGHERARAFLGPQA